MPSSYSYQEVLATRCALEFLRQWYRARLSSSRRNRPIPADDLHAAFLSAEAIYQETIRQYALYDPDDTNTPLGN